MNRRLKGNMTVEASLIFPMVFMVIACLLYMGIYLHDYTLLKAISHEAAERYLGAYTHKVDPLSGKVTTATERLEKGLYWRFRPGEDLSNQMESYIRKEARRKLIGQKSIRVQTRVSRQLLSQHVEIKVKQPFQTPIDPINRWLGIGNGGMLIQAHTQIRVRDQIEFIRNIDMLDDLSDRLDILREAKTSYKRKIQEIIQYLEKL